MAVGDIPGVTVQTPNYGTKSGAIDATFVELYNIDVVPQKFEYIYNQAGKQFGLLQLMGIAARSVNVANQTMKVLEYGLEEQPLLVEDNGATSAAGSTFTIEFATSAYDSNNNCYARVGDSIYVPGSLITIDSSAVSYPVECRLQSVSGTAPNLVFTAAPLNDGFEVAADALNTSSVVIGATKFAAGTAQPEGKTRGLFEYSYYPSIFKESLDIEGGTGAIDRYSDSRVEIGFREPTGLGEGMFETGKTGLYLTKERVAAIWRLYNQINKAMWVGEANSNGTVAAQTSLFGGGTNAVQSFDGYWNLLQDKGAQKDYNNIFEIWDFDITDQIFDSFGVGATEIFMPVSRNLMRTLENNAGLDYVKEYSQGTELFEKSLEKVGARFTKFQKSGRMYYAMVMDNLTNPNSLGLDDLNLLYSGAMFANEDFEMKMNDKPGKLSIPNLTMGNVNYGVENRTLVMDDVAGVNGWGKDFLNANDGMHTYMMAHRMLIAGGLNKQIAINKA